MITLELESIDDNINPLVLWTIRDFTSQRFIYSLQIFNLVQETRNIKEKLFTAEIELHEIQALRKRRQEVREDLAYFNSQVVLLKSRIKFKSAISEDLYKHYLK